MRELPERPSWLLSKAVRAVHAKRYRIAGWLCWLELRWGRADSRYFALCCYAKALYLRGGHHDQRAAALFTEALRLNADYPLAHAGLGTVHHTNAGRVAQEYAGFPGEPAPTLLSGMPPEATYDRSKRPLFVIGAADQECANARIAIFELETAASLSDETEEKAALLTMAAQVHCVLDKDEGKAALRRALDTAPKYAPARQMLASCYAADGEHQLAIREYELLKQSDPRAAAELAESLARDGVEVKRAAHS